MPYETMIAKETEKKTQQAMLSLLF